MTRFVFSFVLLLTLPSFNAQIYTSKEGGTAVSFYSEAPLENIEAVNKGAIIVYRPSTADLQIRISIQNFKFKNSLMQEHFNENYLESEKYPNSEFKGQIKGPVDLTKDGENNVVATGKLTLHGVTRDATINGTLTKIGKELVLSAKFKIKVADYKIQVPSMYIKNIAEVVDVTFNSKLEPFQKKTN